MTITIFKCRICGSIYSVEGDSSSMINYCDKCDHINCLYATSKGSPTESKVVIDFVQHELSVEQKECMAYYGEYVHLKELEPDLFKRIANSPSSMTDICILATDVENFLLEYKRFAADSKIAIHLPLGSPAFMFTLGRIIDHINDLTVIFSHSERVSVEEKLEDGSVAKRSIFKFSHFITFVTYSATDSGRVY